MKLPSLFAASVFFTQLPLMSGAASPDAQTQPRRMMAQDELVSVNAFTANGYKREKTSDGHYKIETYAFGEGGSLSGRTRDQSFQNLSFKTIAQTLAVPLAERRYQPSHSAADTNLLIMVYWGTTEVWGSGTAENATENWKGIKSSTPHRMKTETSSTNVTRTSPRPNNVAEIDRTVANSREAQTASDLVILNQDNEARDQAQDRTARLIGYFDELHSTDELKKYAGLGPHRDDLVGDIEDDRYFVILVACDFQTALKEKKIKPLWWTRYSLRARDSNFDEALLAMSRDASRYFGQDTDGLVRHRIPLGHVEIGTATPMEDKAEK